MGVTRRTESHAMYLSIKDYGLWREFKTKQPNCDEIQVKDPEREGQFITKYGIKYDSLVGRAVKIEEYSREWKGKKFIGFKLHIQDGAELFILDMPYQSRLLRNFLKTAPNFDWSKPLSLRAWKGTNEAGEPEQAIWFQQNEQTVKFYFTKDTPRGMPEPRQTRKGWDFQEQQEWLIDHMMNHTVPAIAAAAAKFAPPVPLGDGAQDVPEEPDHEAEPFAPVEGEVRAPQPMPRPAGSDDPAELKVYLERASLTPVNAHKVVGELCDALWEGGEVVAHKAWTDANSGGLPLNELIRSLYKSLAEYRKEKA